MSLTRCFGTPQSRMRVDLDAIAGLRLFDAGAVPSRVDLELRLPHAPRPCPGLQLELLDRARLDDLPVPAHPSPPWFVRSPRGRTRTCMGISPLGSLSPMRLRVPPPAPRRPRGASDPPVPTWEGAGSPGKSSG